jgi:hypothetical protein
MDLSGQYHTALIVPTLAPTLYKFRWASHPVWALWVKFFLSFQEKKTQFLGRLSCFTIKIQHKFFYPPFSNHMMNSWILLS